jgi:hypothetical protein
MQQLKVILRGLFTEPYWGFAASKIQGITKTCILNSSFFFNVYYEETYNCINIVDEPYVFALMCIFCLVV